MTWSLSYWLLQKCRDTACMLDELGYGSLGT
jgi:hypothetical protein